MVHQARWDITDAQNQWTSGTSEVPQFLSAVEWLYSKDLVSRVVGCTCKREG